MLSRFLLCVLVMLIASWQFCLGQDTDTAATSGASADDGRASVDFQDYALYANRFKLDFEQHEVYAEGQVELVTPEGVFEAQRAYYDPDTKSGRLLEASGTISPFRFHADTLLVGPDKTRRIRKARLTTCTEERPHYQLITNELIIYPDLSYRAKKITIEFAHNRLFTIPGFRGSLAEENQTATPAVTVGVNGIDGVYIGASSNIPIGKDGDLDLDARAGTGGLIRGAAVYTHPFSIVNNSIGGTVSITASHREDVTNRFIDDSEEFQGVDLGELTVSRLPVVSIDSNPIRVWGKDSDGALYLGAGYGHYREDPTDVSGNRAQMWGVLRSPTYRMGPVNVYGEAGVRKTEYETDSQTTRVLQLSVESPKESDVYYNISYLHRSASGETPFIFDRVLIPDELFTEVEVPVFDSKHWRLGAWSRYDLDNGRIRDYNVTAIYKQDCLSYGLSYNHASGGFGVGLVINAFGDFRKGVSHIDFSM